MKFKQFLIIEKEYTPSQALEILGVDSETANDKDKLKKVYQRLALQNHPDRGGDVELMKKINNAYGVLKKTVVKTSNRIDWETIDRKNFQMALAVRLELMSLFKPENFVNFFSEMSGGQPFSHEILATHPKNNEFKRYGSNDMAGFKVEFFNPDRSVVFELDVWTLVSNIKSSGSLGFGTISYPLSTVTYAFANNKRHKFGKSEWNRTSDHAFLNDPKKIFPIKKVQNILTGKARKKGKFSKRDMHTFLVKKYAAIQPYTDKNDYLVPVGDDVFVYFQRSVMQRQPFWAVKGLYEKKGKWSIVPVPDSNLGFKYAYFKELEETAQTFDKLIKDLRKTKNLKAQAKKTKTFISKNTVDKYA